MKVTIDIVLSDQAKTLLNKMPEVNESDFLAWVISKGPITIGGGRVIEYLEHLENQR